MVTGETTSKNNVKIRLTLKRKKIIMEQKIINSTKKAVKNLINLSLIGEKSLWVDYDEEADVLYISFAKPSKADNAREEKGIITRTRKGKVIGLTVLNASEFSSKENKN